jgi:hypothetical protein
MKKKVRLSSLIALSLFFTFSLGVFAAPKLSLWFNNKAQKTDVRLINNKPYVPLADVAKLFGGKVEFDKKANAYKVTSKDYKPPTTLKSFPVNISKTTGPMKLTISKVTVDPAYKLTGFKTPVKALILDVKIQNTSKDKVTWHATGGLASVNTGEQIQYKIGLNDIDGSFLGNVTKSGKYLLKIDNSNLDLINSIQFNIDAPFSSDYEQIGEELLFDVKFR